MSGHQGPQQQAGHGSESGHQADTHPRADTNEQDQQSIDERATLDSVELLQVDFQTHREQQVHRPQIREQLDRFTAAVHPVEGVWSDHNAGHQQTHKIR